MKKLEKDDLGFLVTRELLAILDDTKASAADRIAVWEHVRGIRTMTGFAGTMAEGIKTGINKMNNDRYARIEHKREYQRNFSKKEQSSAIVDDETRLETMNDDENHNISKVSSVKVSKVGKESPKGPQGGQLGGPAKDTCRFSHKTGKVTGRGAEEVRQILEDVARIGFVNAADEQKVTTALVGIMNIRASDGRSTYAPSVVRARIYDWLEYWKGIPSDKVPSALQDWIRAAKFMAAVPQKKNGGDECTRFGLEIA